METNSFHSSTYSTLSSIDSIKSRVAIRKQFKFIPRTSLQTRMKRLEAYNKSCDIQNTSKSSLNTEIQTQLREPVENKIILSSIDTLRFPSTIQGYSYCNRFDKKDL